MSVKVEEPRTVALAVMADRSCSEELIAASTEWLAEYDALNSEIAESKRRGKYSQFTSDSIAKNWMRDDEILVLYRRLRSGELVEKQLSSAFRAVAALRREELAQRKKATR